MIGIPDLRVVCLCLGTTVSGPAYRLITTCLLVRNGLILFAMNEINGCRAVLLQSVKLGHSRKAILEQTVEGRRSARDPVETH